MSQPERANQQSKPRAKREAPKSLSRPPNVVEIDRSAVFVWRGADYPVLPAGRYTVRGVRIQGPMWVYAYRRWSLRVEFTLIDEPVSLSAFFNFGNDRSGCKIGRMSRFYKAWVIAKGEHPRHGERMSPNIFLEGQIFEVDVEECNRDSEGKPKQDAEMYSRIVRIVSAKWP